MTTTEHTINDAFAGLLERTKHAWVRDKAVRSENTGVFKSAGKQPDILLLEPNRFPVVIETEVIPARTVEFDAKNRLGERVSTTGKEVLASIAVRMPEHLRTLAGRSLRQALIECTEFGYALFAGSHPTDAERWPRRGWLKGGIAQISALAQWVSIPSKLIDQSADVLVEGVQQASFLLGQLEHEYPDTLRKIAASLRQETSEQTNRMAMSILANALVFHENLVGIGGELSDLRSIDEIVTTFGHVSRAELLADWEKILALDYWAIFHVAREILEVLPAKRSAEILDRLKAAANRLLESDLARSHDITGAIFQKLIADRKFLAAYYTTPASAALLAGLALHGSATPSGANWGSRKAIEDLRIADFACGTGTLLSTVYQRISQLYEFAGGDANDLHPEMMAHSLTGCDVLPAAAHLTASMLSGINLSSRFARSAIMTVPYGKQQDGSVALGSLDLLESQGTFPVLSIAAIAAGGRGGHEADTWADLPHASFDLVIMNPPFTRATGHEGKKVGVPIPMFAAFRSPEDVQRRMSKRTQQIVEGTSAHGNAGEASYFLVLADRKLKQGGILALVMPQTLLAGEAWEKSRQLLKNSYAHILIVTIAGHGHNEMSFSADTGMAECLVVARKTAKGGKRGYFVVLDRRPSSPMEGAELARQIVAAVESGAVRSLEEGPFDGSPLTLGDDRIGSLVEAEFPATGVWPLSRVSDISLAQCAYQLSAKRRLWLPGMSESETVAIHICPAGSIGTVGPYHMDINGGKQGGLFRGPFEIVELRDNTIPTFPVLWAHDAEKERTVLVAPDCEGILRKGKTKTEDKVLREKASRISSSASHAHVNRDFQFNSQSTSSVYTETLTIGGRAWPSLRFPTEELEKVFTLWSNTTLGMLLYWWHSNKQQSGRGSIPITALDSLPILDLSKLSKRQIQAGFRLFDEVSQVELQPLNQIDKDSNRDLIDREFCVQVLGFDPDLFSRGGAFELLRRKLSREPSIRGGKI